MRVQNLILMVIVANRGERGSYNRRHKPDGLPKL